MKEVILTPLDLRLLLEVVEDNLETKPALHNIYEKLLNIVALEEIE